MRKLSSLAAILLCALYSFAQTDPHELVKALEPVFKGNAFLLRGFPLESDLKFDSECNAEKTYQKGSWTEAELNVESIEVKGKNIILSGHRAGFARLKPSGPLVRMLVPVEKSVSGSRMIKLTIKGPFLLTAADFLEKIKQRIFVMDINELGSLAPAWWLPYLRGDIVSKTKNGHPIYILKEYGEPSDETENAKIEPFGHMANGDPLYRVAKGGVSAPKPLHSPDPEYSDAARAARYQGTLVLSAIIEKTGDVGEVRILSPLGMGLDDKAVAAVQTWKFNPALKDGAPVSVVVNIEVAFNLY